MCNWQHTGETHSTLCTAGKPIGWASRGVDGTHGSPAHPARLPPRTARALPRTLGICRSARSEPTIFSDPMPACTVVVLVLPPLLLLPLLLLAPLLLPSGGMPSACDGALASGLSWGWEWPGMRRQTAVTPNAAAPHVPGLHAVCSSQRSGPDECPLRALGRCCARASEHAAHLRLGAAAWTPHTACC